MLLETEHYEKQLQHWPTQGRVILANFDEDSVVVYQAYRPEIGNFAAQNGFFGGAFKLSRMSWIKPNFLWMMYRCGWASKADQEVVLAIRITRSAFDEILRLAVHSTFKSEIYTSNESWKRAVDSSDVRLQWDPDHEPNGTKCERRAIQLGLRGDVLYRYSQDSIVEIEDITDFVVQQRENSTSSRYNQLVIPKERVYPVHDHSTIENLRLDVIE